METEDLHRPIPDFRPSTPPVNSSTADNVLRSHRNVVVHFWAVWNGVDPLMDSALQDIRDRLPAETHLVSCEVDDGDCVDFVKSCGVVNVPWLSVFVDGVMHGHLCGLRKPDELLTSIRDLIATPPTSRPWSRFW